jgi:two-component system response regulator HydG
MKPNSSGRVLAVAKADEDRHSLVGALQSVGVRALQADSADKAIGYINDDIDVLVCDLSIDDVPPSHFLQMWKQKRPETEIVVVASEPSVAAAVQAIKAGAFDYVTKPFSRDDLAVTVNRAVESARRGRERGSQHRLLGRPETQPIVGESRQMKDALQRVQRAAPVDSTVLILGESGTGKELIAQALHQGSPRRAGPFVAVNCAAVPPTLVESELFGHVRGAFTGATDRRIGRFEQANGGTLFIDEIGDFELSLQAKLLRVLETRIVTPVGSHEERKVDVRVIAATSRDIHQMVEQGAFREDLYYRLNVVSIRLPSLRERPDDIPLLVEHFLREIAQQNPGRPAPTRVSPEVIQAFVRYRWPGNVRELRNTLESMMVLAEGDTLQESDLPERLRPAGNGYPTIHDIPFGLTMEELERLAILKALDHFQGNRTRAAKQLGISLRTLQRKLRDYARAAGPAAANGDGRPA